MSQAPSGRALKQVRLKVPVVDDDLARLEVGTVVYLDGVIYTGREGLYKRLLQDKVAPPVELSTLSNVNFHCSPAASVGADGTCQVGAVTATASFRFSKWMADWFRLSGVKAIIGKGGMSEDDYRTYFVPNRAVYLTTVGYGTGALLGRGIKRVRNVYWLEELGIAQAMWVFEVENFGPLLVDSDLAGNSLFERANRETAAQIDRLYEGLKAPSLRRYGETTSHDDEVI
ncbi:MAG: fumarate hydratase C-terminal domain-containing protein [Proteobacteria bacterium]|nr:fumarate hydratase C-terminal domain-containing protein [Pseudomonadota bacterium]